MFEHLLDTLEKMGLRPTAFIAGAAGGTISVIIENEGKPWWHSLINVTAGAVAAAYITPLLIYYMNKPYGLENALAFIVGLTFLKLTDKLLKFIKHNDFHSIIRLILFKKK